MIISGWSVSLALPYVLEGKEPVPELSRALEVKSCRRLFHLGSYVLLDAVILALEEHDDLLDHSAVALFAHRAEARCHALADVVVQAGALLAYVSREDLPAALEREDIRDGLQHQRAVARHVGAEVDGTRLSRFGLGTEGLEHPRVLLVQCDADIRVALVVTEQNVVAGLVALDEIGLEQQRLGLASNDGVLEVGDVRDHRRDLGDRDRPAAEIALQSVAEFLRLADINNSPAAIFHKIDSGTERYCVKPRVELAAHN